MVARTQHRSKSAPTLIPTCRMVFLHVFRIADETGRLLDIEVDMHPVVAITMDREPSGAIDKQTLIIEPESKSWLIRTECLDGELIACGWPPSEDWARLRLRRERMKQEALRREGPHS